MAKKTKKENNETIQKFKSKIDYLFVEGIQFIKGFYETEDENEIKILNSYPATIMQVFEEVEKEKAETKAEEKEVGENE